MQLNPATLQLSHDCILAITKIRSHRSFQDLKGFYKMFGTYGVQLRTISVQIDNNIFPLGTVLSRKVILGVRLVAIQNKVEQRNKESVSNEFKSSVNASVGIAKYLNVQGFQDKGELSQKEKEQGLWTNNVNWSAVGGESALSVE